MKANAYGHGMKEVVSVLENYADAFGVDDVQELVKLRRYTEKEVYVLGHVCEEDVKTAIEANGTVSIYDKNSLENVVRAVTKAKSPVKVNLKIDAFLGRQGVLIEELPDMLTHLKEKQKIQLKGVYSHFSNIEDTDDFSHAQKQIDAYIKAIEMVEKYGFTEFEKHISSTAGNLVFKDEEEYFTHVRLGIGLYGIWPSDKIKTGLEKEIKLEPVLQWTSCIAQVKTVAADYPIGYGCSFITTKLTTIAIVPQGYSDGYDRGLSNKGNVLVEGQRCPILGRVAMNMFVIDVSGVRNVKVEDEVVLIGKQGSEEILADEIAFQTDTIAYEVVARISPTIPRKLT